jgi:hypothetical protein
MRERESMREIERPASEAMPNVCAVSDGKAGAYCTVGLVKFLIYIPIVQTTRKSLQFHVNQYLLK